MPKKRVSRNEVFECITIRRRLDTLEGKKIINSFIPGHYSEYVQAELIKRGKPNKYTETQIRRIRNGEIYDLEVWQILEKISDPKKESPINIPLTK